MGKPGGRRGLVTGALFFSLTMNVVGAGNLTEVKAYLNTGIKVMLYGKRFEPVEPGSGTKLVPITYRGSTYLPMRAVAEAAGMKVTWDANTQTAYLGEAEGDIAAEINYIKASPEFTYNGDKTYRLASRTPDELKTAAGTVFDFGYVTGGYRSVNLQVNANFECDKFKAKFYAADSLSDEDLTIKITDENQVVVKEQKVKDGSVTELELGVKDAKTLYVYVQGDQSILGEPMLGK
ncbi:stalk domain-containing protein [Cohnella sp. CFH 77786]|uniref:stalk domain-containing protein n=1 Tax=Cohnella sp. CFH 77786 TaxID=2662265 RepID=UPI001C60F592|nr:stalk domain-containing protein [Cohnella sp. CFH 77786]